MIALIMLFVIAFVALGLAIVEQPPREPQLQPAASTPEPAAQVPPVATPPAEPAEVVATPDVDDADEVAAPQLEHVERAGSAAPEPADEFATGTVTVTVVPWGTVVINGAERGTQRRQKHALSPGRHTVELHQSGAAVARKTVDVQPGKNTMVKLVAAP